MGEAPPRGADSPSGVEIDLGLLRSLEQQSRRILLRNRTFFQLLQQRRDLVRNDIPEDIFVDPEVLVDYDVSEGRDLPPFKWWESRAGLFGNVLGGLSDDFEISQHGIIGFLVGEKLFPFNTGCEAQNFIARSMNILEEEFVSTRHDGRLVR